MCRPSESGGGGGSSGYDYGAAQRRAEAERARQEAERQRRLEEKRRREEEERRKQEEFEQGKQEALGSLKGVSLDEPGLKGVSAGVDGLQGAGSDDFGLKSVRVDPSAELKGADDPDQEPVPEKPKGPCGWPVVPSPGPADPDPCAQKGINVTCIAGGHYICCGDGAQAAFSRTGSDGPDAGCCFNSLQECNKNGAGHVCYSCGSNQ